MVRELVILRHGLHAERNFPHLGLREVCQRLLEMLEQNDSLALPEALNWLGSIPMGREEFMRLAR